MATLTGDIQKRTTLTANTETVVAFVNDYRNFSLKVSGGTVLFKINGTISGADDLTANTVDNVFEGHEPGKINTIHLFSTAAASVQWHVD